MNLDAFFNKYNGQSVLFAPSPAREFLRGQCVQLVALYVSECWAKPVIWDDAYGWFIDGRLPEHYVRIANNKADPNQVPPRGAIMIFGPNTPGSAGAGHMSIAWDVRPGSPTFVSFDSNWGGKTAHLVTHNWQYVAGWIVPKTLPIITAVPQQGEEMIASPDEAVKIYKMLRPNGGPNQGEIDATAGKRSYHNFLNDAQPEIAARDANFARQAEEFVKSQATINSLNQTITALRGDESLSQEQIRAAHEKISYLTSQLDTSQAKIIQLQNVNLPAVAAAQALKPNWLTRAVLAVLPKKK
jgi:hypothetical protein